MPLVLEPNAKYEIILNSDKDKPEGKQPTFIFKYLSGREWKQIAQKSDAFDRAAKGEEVINLVFGAIKISLVGWRNMVGPDGVEIPYDPDELDSILTPGEAVELMQAAVGQRPTIEDKKKFDLPSGLDTEASVKPAQD